VNVNEDLINIFVYIYIMRLGQLIGKLIVILAKGEIYKYVIKAFIIEFS